MCISREAKNKIDLLTISLVVFIGFSKGAYSKYPIRKINNKTKRAVIGIKKSYIERGDLLEILDPELHSIDRIRGKCKAKVLRVVKKKALISTRNCDFNISKKHEVVDIDDDFELLESDVYGDDESRPRGIANIEEEGLEEEKTKIERFYFEGFAGVGIGIAKISDIDTRGRGLNLSGILSFYKRREFSVILSGSSGSGDVTIGSSIYEFEYSSGSAGIVISPTIFSSTLRPLLISTSTTTDVEFTEEDVKTETNVKILLYGLHFDFSKKRENDFARLYLTKSRSTITFDSKDSSIKSKGKGIGAIFRQSNKVNGWYQLGYHRDSDESKLWNISASIRYKSFFASYDYGNLGDGDHQDEMEIMFFFDF